MFQICCFYYNRNNNKNNNKTNRSKINDSKRVYSCFINSFTFIYIKSKKKDKNDNNPMNTARVFDSYILIIILLGLIILSIFK